MLKHRACRREPPANSPEAAAAASMPPYRVRGGLRVLEGAERLTADNSP